MKTTEDMFRSLTKEAKDKFKSKRHNYYLEVQSLAKSCEGMDLDKFHSRMKKLYGDNYLKDSEYLAVKEMMFIKSNNENWEQNCHLKTESEVKSIIDKLVLRDTSILFDTFVEKQTSKVAGILKGRKVEIPFKKINDELQSYIKFKLEDGSEFEMKCQLIHKKSSYKKLFSSFPTTFHNAKDKYGNVILNPSEKKLKTIL